MATKLSCVLLFPWLASFSAVCWVFLHSGGRLSHHTQVWQCEVHAAGKDHSWGTVLGVPHVADHFLIRISGKYKMGIFTDTSLPASWETRE